MTNDNAGSPAPSPDVSGEPTQEVISQEVTGDTEVTEEAPPEAAKPNDPHKLENALNKAKAKGQEKAYLLKQERLRTQQLMQELEQLRSGQSTKPANPEPDDVERFVDSRAEKIASAKIQEQLDRIREQQTASQRQSEFKQKVETFKDRMPDIMDVLEANRDAELPNYLVEAIATLPEGPAIAAYAFKEDLMDEIADMSPALAMMEIARIRNTILELGTAKPVTKTPAPMKAVRGNSSVAKSLENMSSRELMQWLKT